jgi:hypothetical protein
MPSLEPVGASGDFKAGLLSRIQGRTNNLDAALVPQFQALLAPHC